MWKARFIVCPRCQRLRRALYAWEVDRWRTNFARVATSQCRICAGLRNALEGGALMLHPRTALGRLMEAVENTSISPRPESYYPYVFVNPLDVKSILWASDESSALQRAEQNRAIEYIKVKNLILPSFG